MVITYICVLWILFEFSFIVPAFAVSVQTFPSDVNLYEDTYIDLICDYNITEAVDTVVDISFMWTAHDSNGTSINIGGDEYNITDQSYDSILRIKQLTIPRDHMAVYSCLVRATPIAGSVYITGNISNINNLTLFVSGKLRNNCVFGSLFFACYTCFSNLFVVN